MEKLNGRKIDSGVILAIYIALKPLYLFESGSLQIGDIFLCISFLYLIIKNRFVLRFSKDAVLFRKSFYFTLYVLIINLLWFGVYSFSEGKFQTSFITYSFYYIFNFFSIITCLLIIQNIGVKRTLFSVSRGCVLSALVNLIGLILYRGMKFRTTGFFNNPNQLGFYAVILLTFVFCLREFFSKREKIFVFLVVVYSVVSSLSKAAFLSVVIMLFLVLMKREQNKDSTGKTKNKSFLRLIIFLLLAVGVYCFFFTNMISQIGNITLIRMRQRLLMINRENDSGLGAGRGYNRIYEMGIHFLWGMGEGYFSRFKTLSGYEVHSTYASILVSYGLIGFLLFVMVVGYILMKKANRVNNLCVFSGIILYCVTHNGARNTLFWILLTLVWAKQNLSSDVACSTNYFADVEI